MIANGVDLVTTAKELGHANASTTASIYAHQIAIAKAKAADVRAGVCLPAEARSPRKREHDVPKPKNPIILQASILTRKVEEKFSKSSDFATFKNLDFAVNPKVNPKPI